MISKQLVTDLIEERIAGTDIFLVSLSISSSNSIKVVVDADSGVSIEKCISVSRNIEHNLDREDEDFSLEVTSFGLGEPLQLKRQYNKNIGRNLIITLNDESKLKGKLQLVEENQITIERELTKKEIKEGINAVVVIAFKDIKETKIEISFK